MRPLDTCELFRRARHGAERRRRASPRAATATSAACRSARRRSAASCTATTCSTPAAQRWRVIAGYGHSPEHASLFCRRARRAHRRRHAAAEDQHQRRRLAVRSRRRSARPLPATRSTAFEALPPDSAGAAVARIAVPRHRDARRAAARASRRAAGRALGRHRRRAKRRSPPREMVPVLFRRPLDLQQRFFAMGEAIAHLNHLWRRDRIRAHCCAADGTLPLRNLDTYKHKRGDPRCPHPPPKNQVQARSGRARRIARVRRREERQGHGRVRGAQRQVGRSAAIRRARPRQGVHGARRADARQSRRGSPNRR